eukprot:12949116-Alexandrium_andersonii.AAC.1
MALLWACQVQFSQCVINVRVCHSDVAMFLQDRAISHKGRGLWGTIGSVIAFVRSRHNVVFHHESPKVQGPWQVLARMAARHEAHFHSGAQH